MPPTDYDAMLQDASNHMSRSQFLRRLSTHSSSTSSSSRRGSARVTKQNSAGNSPHYVQRRRTTASYPARTNPRIPQDSPYQTREQRLRNYYSSREPLPMERPMSWHPGSETIQRPSTHIPTSEPALGNTIAGLESLAVSGTPASSVQQSIENAFAMGYGCPISKPPTMYEQSPAYLAESEAAAQSAYNSYASYNVPDQPSYPYVPTYDMYPPACYQSTQWPQVEPDFIVDHQTSQAPPDYLPVQDPPYIPPKLHINTVSHVRKKRSKELVGMGLYDNEDHDLISTLNSATSEAPNRESVGKGLKLEETWQPPNDDDEEDDGEDDDEGYSTDEAEEVEEDPSILASKSSDAQTAFYPTYGDLSNQSFFFSDDDQYPSEDAYANYLTFGQELQGSQLKPQDAGTGNFLWF